MLDVAGVPLYRQIQSDLRERISSGQLPPGSRLETEQELMARYEVSRATVRQALAGLVNEGLVEIRRGLDVGDQVIISDMSRWDEFDRVRLR